MKKKLLLTISLIFLIMILILINYHEKILGKYNQLKNLKVRNDSLALKLENKEKELSELTEYVKNNITENLNFNFIDEDFKNLGNHKIKIETYSNPLIKYIGKRASLEYSENNLFIITGHGEIFFKKNFEISAKKINFKKIKTNLSDFVDKNYIAWAETPFKDILIKNSKIYVSLTNWKSKSIPFNPTKDNCFFSEIYVSKYSEEKLDFKKFFTMNECMPIFTNSAGTIMEKYIEDKILLTIGDYGACGKLAKNYAQDDNHLAGKIISIDEKDKSYKIISKGHRNQQGIFYDPINNIIISTEHGPKGGDEININYLNDNISGIKDYGWGSVSYGEHYPTNEKYAKKISLACPLNKSHKKKNFIEPIKYFVPSIAITQIILENNFIINNNNYYTAYFTSLGYTAKDGRRSFHKITLSKNKDGKFELIDHDYATIGDRIRDMIYIDKFKSFILFMELDGTIAKVSLLN